MTIHAYMRPDSEIVPTRSEALAEAYAAQHGGVALKAEVPDTAWELTDSGVRLVVAKLEGCQ